jgi:hypothetical protein
MRVLLPASADSLASWRALGQVLAPPPAGWDSAVRARRPAPAAAPRMRTASGSSLGQLDRPVGGREPGSRRHADGGGRAAETSKTTPSSSRPSPPPRHGRPGRVPATRSNARQDRAHAAEADRLRTELAGAGTSFSRGAPGGTSRASAPRSAPFATSTTPTASASRRKPTPAARAAPPTSTRGASGHPLGWQLGKGRGVLAKRLAGQRTKLQAHRGSWQASLSRPR